MSVLTSRWSAFLFATGVLWLSTVGTAAQEARRDGLWMVEYDADAGINVNTMQMTIYPATEPLPALKYELIPGPADRRPGNAAVHYLKALGFLEQDSARERILRFRREQYEKLRKRGAEEREVAPPDLWREQHPSELPLEQVKKYLADFEFQVPYLAEAASRDRFDMDRQIEHVRDLYSYLLPEVQVMRELARTQSLRLRVAVAERRLDDAVEILGQQFALARHLGQDEFLVTSLVGIAIVGIAWQDALLVVQDPEAPSLYWALARLPRPVVSTERAMDNERRFVFVQFKALREVDEKPRPASYWREFFAEIWTGLGVFGEGELGFRLPGNRPDTIRAGSTAFVIAAYPGAKKYLIEHWGMSAKQVEEYPTAQVAALATVRFYQQWRDEYFKWFSLPQNEVRRRRDYESLDRRFQQAVEETGPAAMLASLMLPALKAVHTASARSDDTLNMLAAVEAIRLYAGKHATLPDSLDDLDVPAHIIVGSTGALGYRREGDRAILTGNRFPGLQYRLVLKLGHR